MCIRDRFHPHRSVGAVSLWARLCRHPEHSGDRCLQLPRLDDGKPGKRRHDSEQNGASGEHAGHLQSPRGPSRVGRNDEHRDHGDLLLLVCCCLARAHSAPAQSSGVQGVEGHPVGAQACRHRQHRREVHGATGAVGAVLPGGELGRGSGGAMSINLLPNVTGHTVANWPLQTGDLTDHSGNGNHLSSIDVATHAPSAPVWATIGTGLVGIDLGAVTTNALTVTNHAPFRFTGPFTFEWIGAERFTFTHTYFTCATPPARDGGFGNGVPDVVDSLYTLYWSAFGVAAISDKF